MIRPVFVALIRGINITGNNMLPMKSLAALMETLRCRNVRTYLQSGNAVFECASSDPARMASRLTAAIEKAHGFAPRVLVLTGAEIARAVKRNPFPQADANPATLHLFFLAEKPKRPDLDAIAAVAANGEQFHLDGRVFYLYTPNGFGTSKLAGRVERLLGVAATARNWRTSTSLLQMVRSSR